MVLTTGHGKLSFRCVVPFPVEKGVDCSVLILVLLRVMPIYAM